MLPELEIIVFQYLGSDYTKLLKFHPERYIGLKYQQYIANYERSQFEEQLVHNDSVDRSKYIQLKQKEQILENNILKVLSIFKDLNILEAKYIQVRKSCVIGVSWITLPLELPFDDYKPKNDLSKIYIISNKLICDYTYYLFYQQIELPLTPLYKLLFSQIQVLEDFVRSKIYKNIVGNL